MGLISTHLHYALLIVAENNAGWALISTENLRWVDVSDDSHPLRIIAIGELLGRMGGAAGEPC